MASSLESSKKGTLYAYAQGSGNGGKKKPTSSRVQSGPLRHPPAAKTSRYSPVTSRREQRVSPPQPCHGSDPGAKSTSSASAAVSDRLPSLLEFSEVKGDLFSCPSSSSLAHCVSEDLAMGRGVAVLFKKQFGGVGELRDQGVKPGGVAVLKRKERFIYYLVTKKRYFHKPTYESLRSSLEAMRAHCMANGVREICMPRIGCGLDKLEWGRVTAMIQNVFRETEMRITVYYL